MTLFDPYSHTRVHELRQEQLARRARLREKLGVDAPAPRSEPSRFSKGIASAVPFGWRKVTRREQPRTPRSALES